jgi:hypothetical protein
LSSYFSAGVLATATATCSHNIAIRAWFTDFRYQSGELALVLLSFTEELM